MALILTLLLAGCSGGGESGEKREPQTVAQGESLRIPLGGLGETASFYPVEIDGTDMEVLAVKLSDGGIRTAFNTCELCFDSGRGYYEQEGSDLICQNCGNRFGMDEIGRPSRGCNPWPILDADKTLTEEEILISYEFLAGSKRFFGRWKSGA
jgi:uncharacterized membrane protein